MPKAKDIGSKHFLAINPRALSPCEGHGYGHDGRRELEQTQAVTEMMKEVAIVALGMGTEAKWN